MHRIPEIWDNNIEKLIKGGIKMSSKGFDYTALTIVIIGAINWGLIGFFRFDLVSFLFSL